MDLQLLKAFSVPWR